MRLTEHKNGEWGLKDVPWYNLIAGAIITEETRQKLYGALCKLKDYEETGLDPDRIRIMDELYLEKCKEVDKMKRSGQQVAEDNEMDKLITEMAEYICDKRCEIPNEIGRTQEQVDEICSECRMGEFIRKIQNTYDCADGFEKNTGREVACERIVTIGLYFEVRDADMYGGVGTVGYVNVNVECGLEKLTNGKLKNYVESQIKGIAKLCNTSVEKVKVIPRTEYEENTEDD